MPIPTKGFFDPEPESELHDSTKHNAERAASIKAEADYNEEQQAKVRAEYKRQQDIGKQRVKESEIQRLEQYSSLARDPLTRDMILDRIRKMREEKPVEPPWPPPMSEAQRKLLEGEQAAGRAAVAKYEAEMVKNREAAAQAEAEAKKSEGTMTQVFRENPSQDKEYPVNRRKR